MNAAARRLGGVAKDVDMVLGAWKGPVDFSVAPMDDFQVVLGMDFMRKVSAVVMPSFNSVCIFNKDSPCMISGTSGPKAEAKQLSAMQVAKGAKRGEPTFLATLKLRFVMRRWIIKGTTFHP